MSKLETQIIEDINISYNKKLCSYVIDISYRHTDSEGNVDIISITDLPITINNYASIEHGISTFCGCCDTTTTIDLGFGRLNFHPTLTRCETRRVYTATKEMTLEEIEKKLGYKIKVISKEDK